MHSRTTKYNPFPFTIGDTAATLLSIFVDVDVLRDLFENFKGNVESYPYGDI